MPGRVRIYSYHQASEGSRNLAEAMGIKRLKKEKSKFNPSRGDVIINWGSGTLPEDILMSGCKILNAPEMVRRVSNKVQAFQLLEGHCRIPPYTTSVAVARDWVEERGKKVFARTVLNGHSGAGIEIMDPEHPDTWNVRAGLYTQYVPKKDEYRVHIVNGRVIDTQRKGLPENIPRDNVNWMVRNLANGFIFVRNDGRPVPEDVINQAIAAMNRSGLNFGAVDVIWNETQRQAYVLEINTAPGLVGTTVENYSRALTELAR